MADYPTALDPLLDNEDGKNRHWFYESNKEAEATGDTGKETVHGISRKNWPTWPGWLLVDAARTQPNFPKSLLTNPDLMPLVQTFYHDHFWEPICGDQINSQNLATQALDMAVNAGTEEAVLLLQRSVNFVDNCLKEDGQMGPVTLGTVNRLCFSVVNGLALIHRWLDLRRAFYHALADRLAANGSPEAKDLPVWLARCVVPGLDY